MHELSLVEGIRELALRHARLARAPRLLSVRVVIPATSTYLEDAMAMLWDEVCAGTEAAGARLETVRVPASSRCLACSYAFTVAGDGCKCPNCGSEWVKPTAGQDCYVESIEVDGPGE